MGKELKTNAMRQLDRMKIPYVCHEYLCDNFVDGVSIADQQGQSYDKSFKTLVMQGKSGKYYVFVLPVDKEVDRKKAARVVHEKSIDMIPVKEINQVTGYIRGGCTPIGMKKKYPTIIHESAKVLDEMIISGGRIGEQIFLLPADLLKATDGKFADIIVC
jgi:Cys-tRNA(Pro)/Cys-tRNA(Cys) deacylase